MSNPERCSSPTKNRRLSLENIIFRRIFDSDLSSDEEETPKAAPDDATSEKKIPQTSSPPLSDNEAEPEITNAGDNSGTADAATPPAAPPAAPQDVSVEEESNQPRNEVRNNGADAQTITAAPRTDVPEVPGGRRRYMIAVGIVAIVAFLVQQLQTDSPPLKNDMQIIDIFLERMEKVKSQFPNQRVEMWSRSRIHLKRHLEMAQPTQPVSLILTAGLNAQKTLHCLAKSMASAFSAAHNASVLLIDGATSASQDSDFVKLDIDGKLQEAFEGNTPVAIIHRFEELPPGSTLIFYRYCDHENAAYKKSFLIFTVLLGEEELPAELRLSDVEEMVDDHLQRKFLSHGNPVSFDTMDLDKYGGLWSRISHLILPVATEERIERQGCGMT